MYGDELIVSNENIAAIQIMESSYSCNIFPILLTEIFLVFFVVVDLISSMC